ncbi:MAG: T9SS type A sorting domain-containing protein [Chitinophagaceae bacterium]|nr:T9SS type A sorting domain-containing protein [Chitinophagaceae bacterium]
MKYFNKTSLSLLLVVMTAYLSMFNYSGSYVSNGGRTNAPFDNGNCGTGSGCHSGGSYNPSTTIQLLDGSTPVTTYTSSKSYTVRLTISASGTSSSTRYGMQMVCVQSSNSSNINTWGSIPSGFHTNTISSRTYISHSNPKTTNVMDFPWTSPATTTGNITFYASGLVANGNNNQTFDNVASGSLTITPASSGGCTTPSVNMNITHVDCYGNKTGAINVSTTGGSSPFSFDWTGPNFSANTQNISGLGGGSYTLIVTATGGCKDTFYATVIEPSKFTATVNSNSPVCLGDLIALSASASGGNGGYSYTWTGPGSASSSSSTLNIPSATAANTGDYILTIKDGKNCIVKDTVMVEVDSLPQLDSITIDMQTHNTYKFTMANPRFVTSTQWLFGDGKSSTATSPTNTYTANGSYKGKLILTNQCGKDTVDFTVNIWPDGVSRIDTKELSVFPNPADKYIEVQASTSITACKLITMQGVTIYSSEINGQIHKLDVSSYATGMYILQLETKKGKQLLPVYVRH